MQEDSMKTKVTLLLIGALTAVMGLGTICQARVQRLDFTTTGGALKTRSTEMLLYSANKELDGTEVYVDGVKKQSEYHSHVVQPAPRAGTVAPRLGQAALFVPGISDHNHSYYSHDRHGPQLGAGANGGESISPPPSSGVYVHVMTFNSNGTVNDTTTLLNTPRSQGDIFFTSQGMLSNPELRTITYAGGFVTGATKTSASIASSGQWTTIPGPLGVGAFVYFPYSFGGLDWGWIIIQIE